MASSENKKCGVCNGSLTNQATFTAACSHSFHFICIRNTFANNANHLPVCPLCQPISNTINVLQNNIYKSSSVLEQEPLQFSDDDPLLEASPPSSSTVGLQKVTIKAIPERPAVAASESVPQFTVLIGLKAPPLLDDFRAPIDLVTVLDVSGSMSGEKLSLVKHAVHFVIDQLGPRDRLSVVSFSSRAQRVFCLRGMTESGRRDAKLAVDWLWATGAARV
ncbi:PREDICTED: uncharacterized protein LOC105955411 [Erythranthe guttata]|uniref:uncharacterized protein LOC105955411 n=1 Tax=Erythranthe guttata TaxID=4155 RepID=UPI00064D8138|nr:PREDICTED: uncharacterized protein LOC105955411 [Erythranthe guttata]|eukprot:XP_012834579.1 PREDICTED: uncharacterized protein LOC105955411 [Erythranthe guttata]